ncbi:hypothetical protein ACFODZ_14735 [Marinicella sediminis]|uniref:Uncharacterized protein n=2 Tax=Marinicella sediminis TaxID=1792834 RepID=A0ABV7JFC9_9GAMM
MFLNMMDRYVRRNNEDEGVNWSLFILLLGFTLLLRLVIFFGVVSLHCLPFSTYFFQEYQSGLSVLEAVVLIYLLLSAWALIEFIKPVMVTRIARGQTYSTRLIHGLLLVFALLCLFSTLRALSAAEDVVHYRELSKTDGSSLQRHESKSRFKTIYCSVYDKDYLDLSD